MSKKITIYATLIFNKNPDFAKKIVNVFGSLNKSQQTTIYKSIIGAGLVKEANEITNKYGIKVEPNLNLTVEKINNMQFLDKIETQEQLELQTSILDYCWAAFFATGDEKYIAKLFEYAKKHENITKEDVNIIPMDALSWSFRALANQDPQIKEILIKRCQTHHLRLCPIS
ncbi:MAG: hypothetical protein ACHQJ6_08060 [Candidatus Berkiellales bacterium]